MPWFRLDDSFHSHPKVIAAGNEAVGLFVRCGTYAAEHLTDGFVPKDIAHLYGALTARSSGGETLAATLVRAKLWHRARGGWTIHDYLDYNPSREDVERERKQAAQRQKRRRNGIASRRDSQRDNGVTHTTPSRPVPNTPPPPGEPGGHAHAGQHKHCRQCGTNQRGPTPEPPATPTPPPAAEVLTANWQRRVPSEDVAPLLAQARQAMTRKDTDA